MVSVCVSENLQPNVGTGIYVGIYSEMRSPAAWGAKTAGSLCETYNLGEVTHDGRRLRIVGGMPLDRCHL